MQPTNMSDAYAALERRVDRLARGNRALTALLAGALVIGLAAGAGAVSSDEQVLRARAIQLVDDTGRVRAELAIDKDGSAGLFVRDDKDHVRASVTHDENQSALFLWDTDGQIRAGVAHFAHGGSGVALHGPHGKGSTALYYKGAGSLTFYDTDGKTTARVPKPGD